MEADNQILKFVAELPRDGLNLDCQTVDWLFRFMEASDVCYAQTKDAIFPGMAPRDTAGVVHKLERYAAAKIVAMEARERGHIFIAQKYEEQCQELFESLPGFARW
jgi:hypothetical protein